MTTRTLTLCYHALSDSWEDPVAVRVGAFEQQLTRATRAGLRAGRLSDVVTGGNGAPTLAITFDDAFRSVYELAFPVMRRLGLVGVVFVPTAFPESGRGLRWPGFDSDEDPPPPEEMQPLSWDQLGELRDAGWEIGSHTRHHPLLPELDGPELVEELVGARDDLRAALGTGCDALAYPYGAADRRVVAAAASAGYRVGAALVRSLEPAHPLLWPRVGVYRDDGPLRFSVKCSRLVAGRAGAATVLGAQALGRLATGRRGDLLGAG